MMVFKNFCVITIGCWDVALQRLLCHYHANYLNLMFVYLFSPLLTSSSTVSHDHLMCCFCCRCRRWLRCHLAKRRRESTCLHSANRRRRYANTTTVSFHRRRPSSALEHFAVLVPPTQPPRASVSVCEWNAPLHCPSAGQRGCRVQQVDHRSFESIYRFPGQHELWSRRKTHTYTRTCTLAYVQVGRWMTSRTTARPYSNRDTARSKNTQSTSFRPFAYRRVLFLFKTRVPGLFSIHSWSSVVCRNAELVFLNVPLRRINLMNDRGQLFEATRQTGCVKEPFTLHLQRVNFEAIPLYNKIILRPATPEEVRNVTNKHVLQKQKICAWKIKVTP